MKNSDPVRIAFTAVITFFFVSLFAEDGNVGMAKLAPWLTKLVDWVLMSPLLFLHLQKRGVTTYLWVLNTEEQFERAFNLGVQGVMTDYPSRLKQFLDKKRK